MTRSNPSGDRTADAVECFLCLVDPDADPTLRARWTAWLGESAENQAAYHAVRETWNRPVPKDVWPTYEEVVSDPYDGLGPVPLVAARNQKSLGEARPRVPATRQLMQVAGGLLIAVLVVGLWQFLRPSAPPLNSLVYRTGRGEQQRIALSDGSSIILGPMSSINIKGGAAARSARLEGGDAIFAITHDPVHPFKLFANGGEIDDIGTTFGVAVRSGRATVTVVEGAVRVSARTADARTAAVDLTRDQQVSFSEDLGPVGAVDGRAETDWSRGRLVYVDQSLADVVSNLTRYTTRDIVVADPAAQALHYTGTIDTDAIDQWVAALTHAFPLAVDHDGKRLILRSVAKS